MRLTVEHITSYRYDRPVRGVVQSHRLTPSTFEGQKLIDWQVDVTDGIKGGGFRDGAGDFIQGWSITGPVSDITVKVSGTVETTDCTGILRGHRERISPMTYLRDTSITRVDVALAELARSAPTGDGPLAQAHGLAARVAEAIAYAPGTTTAHTSAAEALAQGVGVCQDHAHALIACARDVGMPARYISGYLYADADGVPHEAAHAWAEVWVEGLGWVGFDPANKCCADDRYIRLGSGLDAHDAAPIRGVARGSGSEEIEVSLRVQQIAQSQQ